MTGITVRGVMEYLFARRAPRLPPQGLAEVFDRLLWCLDQAGGAEIEEVRRDWLRSGELEKVEIALSMTEVFPYKTREEMVENLDRPAGEYPSLSDRCRKILKQFDECEK